MWWSYNSLKTSPWAKDGYDAARGRGQHHYRALRGLGARWVRVLWRCWQDRTPYDPQRHRGNRQIDATDGSPEAPAAA